MITTKIRGFLETNTRSRLIPEMTDETGLIENGIIDSFDIVGLVAFLEEAFEIQIGPEDLTDENFLNLRTLESLVQSKQSAR